LEVVETSYNVDVEESFEDVEYFDDDDLQEEGDHHQQNLNLPIDNSNYYCKSPSVNHARDRKGAPELEKPTNFLQTNLKVNEKRSSLETIDTPPTSEDNTAVGGGGSGSDGNNGLAAPLLGGGDGMEQKPRTRSRMGTLLADVFCCCACRCPKFSISLRQQFRLSTIYIVSLCAVNLGMSTYYAWLSSNESSYDPYVASENEKTRSEAKIF